MSEMLYKVPGRWPVCAHVDAEDPLRKIMRRMLRKIAENEFGSLGDTSTLADPSVVDDLIDKRKVGQPRLGGAHHHCWGAPF